MTCAPRALSGRDEIVGGEEVAHKEGVVPGHIIVHSFYQGFPLV